VLNNRSDASSVFFIGLDLYLVYIRGDPVGKLFR
jgi:hypothetical protein